jgi:hypothetical protein
MGMAAPGIAGIHNLYPTQFFGLKLTAALSIHTRQFFVMWVIGSIIFDKMVAWAQKNGETFVPKDGDFPAPWTSRMKTAPALEAAVPLLAFPLHSQSCSASVLFSTK